MIKEQIKKESEESFLDWLLEPNKKIKQFQKIKEHMKQTYLSDPYDIVIAFSGGKDSTLVATLMWEMLEGLTPEQRHKNVHIVSSDTLVETRQLTNHLHSNLEMMDQNGKYLGIKVHLVQPTLKQSYFRHVIGLGVIPPAPGKGFQWCTDRLKISPMNAKMKEILGQQPILFEESYDYQLTICLGTRLAESPKRAASVRRHTREEFFGKHDYVPQTRVYHPIKYVSTDDLWNYLRYNRTQLPWGTPLESLEALYSSSTMKECPVIRSKKELKQSCGGNSRNGCWTCLMSGRKDKMLEELIAKGDTSVSYLADWKAFLYDIIFDVRYKDPIKKINQIEDKTKEIERSQGFLSDYEIWYDNEFDRYTNEYQQFERASKGEYDPGKLTFEMRRMLMEKLLYAQHMCGYSLISDEEINLILEEWEKDGYIVSKDELRPINHQHDGAVVLRRDWSINEKETTNPNPIFFVNVPLTMSASELAVYHKKRQRLTGKSIFCFYGHTDYQHMKFSHNHATFLVCQSGISTQEQATEYVYNWLFLSGEQSIGINGKPYTKMSKEAVNASLKLLILDSLQEAVVSLDHQISLLKEHPEKLHLLSNEEQEKIPKKWVLYQRWLRLEKRPDKKNNSLDNSSKTIENDTFYEGKNGQLIFEF